MGVRVIELFAGVGGFRLGLERTGAPFDTVWFNQWEPSIKTQHAHNCYVEHFLEGQNPPAGSNRDITQVTHQAMDVVPEHDLLVGGFPCQDYSVATTLDKSGGIDGTKGKLWWAIDDILKARRPPYVLLENVNTLLSKPARKRGRAFGVILSCLAKHGYVVEWRVINAAEYGTRQRRRRVFIFAAREDTSIGKMMADRAGKSTYLIADGFFPSRFPVAHGAVTEEPVPMSGKIPKSPVTTSRDFTAHFQNAGVMVDGNFWTQRVDAATGEALTIGDILEKDGVDESYFIDPNRLADWEFQKDAKAEPRKAKNGHEYLYKEGKMQFPDLHTSPSRTILTSEANRTPNRSTHVVKDPKTGNLRFLTPLECERLNGFDDGWTKNLPTRWRYFTMGNALVVNLITDMGHQLVQWIEDHENAKVRKALLNERQALVRASR